MINNAVRLAPVAAAAVAQAPVVPVILATGAVICLTILAVKATEVVFEKNDAKFSAKC